ncbi:chemotaxis protein [Azospirillum sp. TSH100]|uniref:CheR family methyltransferase n=1 Tax=Azospirillum sp. TSH100 TaxID=652764 RepID=UPI000D611314|nr:protein-glutamate O-methyltransferase CheR [Azospirillum sp. TSH100]PWC85249.1 chemotaxis protein [Azospirillum sp. TSH100]QCG88828.1 protein-glutamate O-methyltransferase CheR [Azospirillum sp. TSH100]
MMPNPSATIESIRRDPHFPRLKAMVIDATGLAYYADKDAAFAERINRRLPFGPIATVAGYLAALEAEGPGGPEYQGLINELAVGETFFFRYVEQFDALRAVAIPECLRRNQSSRLLRIWSAGCSIGPEAYTIEILLKQHFAAQLEGWQVHIVGTDINGAFLEQARRGAYGDWAVRGLSPETLEACFDRRDRLWSVKPKYRQWTSFMPFNLVDGAIPSYPHGIGHFDIILCRNVMIYFDEATRHRLLGDLHKALAEGGWLVVGHAEAGPQMNELFIPVSVPGATLYRKQAETTTTAAPIRSATAVPAPAAPVATIAPRRAGRSAAKLATDAAGPVSAPRSRRTVLASSSVEPTPPDAPETNERSSVLEACLARVEAQRLDPAAHYHLGLVEEELGVGDPVAAFKRALYLDPRFVLADYHLALAYWRRGRLVPAQRHFRNAREALESRPDDEAVTEGGGLTVQELRGMLDLWLTGEEG